MDVKERISNCIILEQINSNPTIAEKLGLKDSSINLINDESPPKNVVSTLHTREEKVLWDITI